MRLGPHGLLVSALGLSAALLLPARLGAQKPQPAKESLPSDVTPDVYVTGVFTFTTNGRSPRYQLTENDPSTTRIREEHSSWRLAYLRDQDTFQVRVHALQWMHRQITEKWFSAGDLKEVETIENDSLEGDSSNHPQGPRLMITHVTRLKRLQYRSVALMGTALQILVARSTTVVQHHRNGRIDSIPSGTKRFPLDVSLFIWDWFKAQWKTPYIGSVDATNDYPYYVTPDSTRWLNVHAKWNTRFAFWARGERLQ